MICYLNKWGFLLIVFVAFFPAGESLGQTAEIEWLKFDKGVEKAAGEDKIILLYVETDWCSICKKMKKLVFPHKIIQPLLADSLVPVRLNAEDTLRTINIGKQWLSEADIAEKYQVDRYPAFLFLEPGGKLLYRLNGLQLPRDFRKTLSFFARKEYLIDQ